MARNSFHTAMVLPRAIISVPLDIGLTSQPSNQISVMVPEPDCETGTLSEVKYFHSIAEGIMSDTTYTSNW